MATNRYYQPQRGNYVSQYVDYKLPYEAIQNAVISRQQQFDRNQLMLANSANKYAQIASRKQDALGKAQMIDTWLGDVNNIVNSKYGGDFSLAAGDIYNETAKFTNDPRWTAISDALAKETAFKELQARADATYGADLYKTRNFTGNRSIFAADGTIQDVNYDALMTNAPEYRKYNEQLFNNAKINKSTGDLKALNEAVLKGDQAMIGWYDREYIDFNDQYVDAALATYKEANLPEYQKYYDQALQNGNDPDQARKIADMKALNDITSAKLEQEVDRYTLKATKNPLIGTGSGKTPSFGDMNSLQDIATPTVSDPDNPNTSPESVRDLENILENPNSTPAQQLMARELLNLTDELLETSDTQKSQTYRTRKGEYDTAVERDLPYLTQEYGSGAADMLFDTEDGSAEQTNNQIMMDALISAKVDPNNKNDVTSGLEIFTQRLGTLAETIGTGIGNIFNAGTGGQNLMEAVLTWKVGMNEAEEMEFNNLFANTTSDPEEAAVEIANYIQNNPDFIQRIKVPTDNGEIGFQGDLKPRPQSYQLGGGNLPSGSYKASLDTYSEKEINTGDKTVKLEDLNKEFNRTNKQFKQAKEAAENEHVTALGTRDRQEVYYQTLDGKWKDQVKDVLPTALRNIVTTEDIKEQLGVSISDEALAGVLKEFGNKVGDIDKLRVVRDRLYGGVEVYIPAVDLLPATAAGARKSGAEFKNNEFKIRLDRTHLQDDFDQLFHATESMVGVIQAGNEALARTGVSLGINQVPINGKMEFVVDYNIDGINGTPTYEQLYNKLRQTYGGTLPKTLEAAFQKVDERGFWDKPAYATAGRTNPQTNRMIIDDIVGYFLPKR